MISNHSFWTSVRENMRRRRWFFVISSIVLFFAYPVRIAIILSGENFAGKDTETLVKDAFSIMGFDLTTAILLSLAAVIGGVLGFSYLFSRRKVDMYHSQPVGEGKRFAVIYVNGVILYFIPYFFSLLVSSVVVARYGISLKVIGAGIFGTLAYSLVYYLAVYNLAIFAVMLTGHPVVTFMGITIFMGYEWVVEKIIWNYYTYFFSSFVYGKEWGMAWTPSVSFSPIYRAFKMVEIVRGIWEVKGLDGVEVGRVIHGPMRENFFFTCAVALLWFVLAYLAYTKRPAESCGKALAFPKIQPVIKFLILVPCALLGGAVFYTLSGNSTTFFILGVISGLIISQFAVEIIYALDYRALFRGKRCFLASALVSAFICFVFLGDPFGYDRYVPKEDELEYAGIQIEFQNLYMYDRIDEDYQYLWDNNWILEKMKMKDVAPILELAEGNMSREKIKNSDEKIRCVVKYHKKTGKDIYRKFYLETGKEEEILNRLFADAEYKKCSTPIYGEVLDRLFSEQSVSYYNGMDTTLLDTDTFALMESYRRDYEKSTFSQVGESFPIGVLRVSVPEKARIGEINFPLYESYGETVGKLKELGITLEHQLSADGIESIEIYNYVSTSDESESPLEVFEDRAEVQEIMNSLYPIDLLSWCYDPFVMADLSVTLNTTSDNQGNMYNGHQNSFAFSKKDVPDFVREKMQYFE